MPSVLVFSVRGLAQTAAYGSLAAGGITAGRAQALAALAVGITSVITGAIAMSRSSSHRGRTGALVAIVAAIAGIIAASVRIASTTAIGTGGGRLGAIVALVVSLIGLLLGVLALRRRVHHTRAA